jgi:TonB family protein
MMLETVKTPPKPPTKPTAPSSRRSQIVSEGIPSELGGWVRLVQRKVERVWTTPGGVSMNADENTAVVTFFVDRNGNLMDEPIITQHASDPAIGESGLRAIKASAPFPPLPDGYPRMEQLVEYEFSLIR